MLQFRTVASDRYSVAEEVQMALEGGCRWIQLSVEEVSDEEFRNVAEEVIPLCKETEAFLIFEDRPELALQMGVHGVHLSKKSPAAVAAIREQLGAHAIIGVEAETAEEVAAFRNLDIDYVTIRLLPSAGIEQLGEMVEEVRNEGITLPIVAYGDITLGETAAVVSTGVNGILLGNTIAEADDPAAYTAEVLSRLTK